MDSVSVAGRIRLAAGFSASHAALVTDSAIATAGSPTRKRGPSVNVNHCAHAVSARLLSRPKGDYIARCIAQEHANSVATILSIMQAANSPRSTVLATAMPLPRESCKRVPKVICGTAGRPYGPISTEPRLSIKNGDLPSFAAITGHAGTVERGADCTPIILNTFPPTKPSGQRFKTGVRFAFLAISSATKGDT